MSPTRKVLLTIVEGPSDETALHVPLSHVFDKREVLVQVARGDVTSDRLSRPSSIVKRVYALVRGHMARYGYDKRDVALILHIMDLDGAYAPDDAIREVKGIRKTLYNVTEIVAASKSDIAERNKRKRENMDRLASQGDIAGIPYLAVYMSCNLDHAMHNKLNTSDDDKRRDAYLFARKYGHNPESFVRYICDSDFSIVGEKGESWEYVRKGLHSLERCTNLGICIRPLPRGH